MKGSTAIVFALLSAVLLGGDAGARPAAASSGDVATLRALLAASGLPGAWQVFLTLVAKAESGFNPVAVNRDLGEAAAAATAYDRNARRLVGCTVPRAAYVFGSGGYFGFLPAIAVFQLGAPWSPCIDPSIALFNPRFAVAVAVGYARGLSRYQAYRAAPSWARMRAGWRRPKAMSDPGIVSMKATALEASARELGLGFDPMAMPPPLPTPGATLARLGVG